MDEPRPGARHKGGVLLRALVLVAIAVALWLGWRTISKSPARSARAQTIPSSPASQPRTTPPASQADSHLVIPSSNRSEPAVLVPVSTGLASVQFRDPEPSKVVPTNSPPELGSIRALARTNSTPAGPAPKPPFDERILRTQVALFRRGFSPGSLDGVMGLQTRAALRALQQREHLPPTGADDEATLEKLELDVPLYTIYTVTDGDVDGLQPLGKTWLAKSQQSRLAFETVLELVAEKSRCNPKLVRWLNPDLNWATIAPGASIRIVRADYPPVEQKAAFLRIFLADRKLHVFDANSNLLVHFPCSIAARVDKRPLGEELHIAAIAPNPNYTFDPAVFPESEEARELGRKLILQPGPNNPVGTVWFSLDKAGYGIHGTPKPEEVGRTESHGCFRLANWNAEYLLSLVSIGTPVSVEP